MYMFNVLYIIMYIYITAGKKTPRLFRLYVTFLLLIKFVCLEI